MKFICPTIGEDHEKDFLVMGNIDDFRIVAFSDMGEYEKGYEHLNFLFRHHFKHSQRKQINQQKRDSKRVNHLNPTHLKLHILTYFFRETVLTA